MTRTLTDTAACSNGMTLSSEAGLTMKTTIVVTACSKLALAGCASTPDLKVSYYLPNRIKGARNGIR